MKTYTVGGMGRKQCPCGVFVAASCSYCVSCKHEFIEGGYNKAKEKELKVCKVYEKEGQGKKKCIKCQRIVGNRIEVCPCGNDFAVQKLEQQKIENKPTPQVSEARKFTIGLGYPYHRLVLTPSGNVPVKLNGLSVNEEVIHSWCEQLENYAISEGYVYAPSAVRYFGRKIGLDENGIRAIIEWANRYIAQGTQSENAQEII